MFPQKDAILATDDDEGENARVTYSFPRNERSTLLFNINPRTGLIHTTASIGKKKSLAVTKMKFVFFLFVFFTYA